MANNARYIGNLCVARKCVPRGSARYRAITEKIARAYRVSGITVGDNTATNIIDNGDGTYTDTDTGQVLTDAGSGNAPAASSSGWSTWPLSTKILILGGLFLAGVIAANNKKVKKWTGFAGIGSAADDLVTYAVLGGLGYGVYSYATKGFIYTLFHPIQQLENAAASAGKAINKALKAQQVSNLTTSLQNTDGITAVQTDSGGNPTGVTFADGVTVTDEIPNGQDDNGNPWYQYALSNGENICQTVGVGPDAYPALYNQLHNLATVGAQLAANPDVAAPVDTELDELQNF